MSVTIVNPEMHKFVLAKGDSTIGFSNLTMLVATVEQFYLGEDGSKILARISEAMSDDKGDDLQIFDIDTYVDLFMDNDEDDLDNE